MVHHHKHSHSPKTYNRALILFAMATMEEAEEATLKAICTRLDATTAAGTMQK